MRLPPEGWQGLRRTERCAPGDTQLGLILAAAWVGAVWKGAHGVSLAITEGLKAESGLVSMGLMAGNGRERQCPLVRCSAVGVRFPAGGVL